MAWFKIHQIRTGRKARITSYNVCYTKLLRSNPCGEYLSTKDTACNLLTVNLHKCLAEKFPDYLNNVYENGRLAALAGNEILDLGGFPPIERIKKNTLKFRPIGIGFTGLHHAMNHYDISYRNNFV